MSELDYATTLDVAQERQLWELFQQEWWSRGRTREQVARLLEGPSLIHSLVQSPSRRLAAFARVVTDGVFKAWVFDVVVAPELRGRGYGYALMERVLADPRIAGVAHVELYCAPEMSFFYGRMGFAAPAGVQLLRRKTEEVKNESRQLQT